MSLFVHRVSMIAMLPFACALAVIVGPFLALEMVVERFKHHWKGSNDV